MKSRLDSKPQSYNSLSGTQVYGGATGLPDVGDINYRDFPETKQEAARSHRVEPSSRDNAPCINRR